MWSYFKPLRRKFGVMTLVMACLLLVGWMRSFSRHDQLEVGDRTYRSVDGALSQINTLRVPAGPNRIGSVGQERAWSVPYWTIVAPLAVFSTWLLLSEPRTSTPSQRMEP